MWFGRSPEMVSEADALVGRPSAMEIDPIHAVLGTSMLPPFPAGFEVASVAMGCFWGAERCFWTLPGVHVTAVGYQRGYTPNPTYEEVCSGQTGHTESVLVVFDPERLSYAEVLARFFEQHDPTQGYRQGNDIGTQYRSAITTTTEQQLATAEEMAARYGEALADRGLGSITTDIGPSGPFFYAEGYHQQYLAKNPNGYCGIGGTGVSCPVGLGGLSD